MAKIEREPVPQINSQETILPKLVDLAEQKKVEDTHRIFERSFVDYFRAAGYIEAQPLALISEVDRSVLFTGASISAIKDILLSNDYPAGSNGVYVTQECLRTNALKYAFDNGWIPYGQIYFHMATILSRPGRFDEVIKEAIDYTETRLGVDKARIKILSSDKLPDLSSVHTKTNIKVEYDTKPAKYYQWEYGIKGVHGDGLTICILNPATEKWFDIGNIVKVYGSDGAELGIEFGYGYEFALTAIVGVDQALKFSRIFEFFEFEPGLGQKYYSTLEAVIAMRRAGATLGDRGVDHLYKQYLKSLEYIGENFKRSPSDIFDEMHTFAKFLGLSGISFSQEHQFMDEHRKRKEALRGIVKRIGAYLWAIEKGRTPKEFFEDPNQTLQNYLTANGIKVAEVIPLLERLKRFPTITLLS